MEVITPEAQTTVSNKDLPDLMLNLEARLQPGMPVLIESLRINGKSHHKKTTLFLSGGVLQNGVFNLKTEKRHFVYAQFHPDLTEDYRISISNAEFFPSIYQPKSHIVHVRGHVNERAIDQTPFEWDEEHSNHITKIEIGSSLFEKYLDIIRALRFAGDSLTLTLPMAYIRPKYLIRQIGDSDEKLESQRDRESSNLASVRAVMNLLDNINGGHCGAQQVSYSKNPTKESLFLNDEDFLLFDANIFAYVKPGRGYCWGQTFVLPAKGKDELIESAFAPDNIRKFYPYGLE